MCETMRHEYNVYINKKVKYKNVYIMNYIVWNICVDKAWKL